MKLVGIMPVHDESWVLGASLRAARQWCDEIVVLLHNCSDASEAIVESVAREVGQPYNCAISITFGGGGEYWNEMRDRQNLLDFAREFGATHIALIDADEILTGNLLPIIRGEIEKLKPCETLEVGMLATWRSLDRYRVGRSIWSNRHDLTLAFRDDPSLSWKPLNGYDHHHRAPFGSYRKGYPRLPGGVMHLQWASWRRLTAKHAKYKMMERIKYPAKPAHEIDHMYSLALDETNLELTDVPTEWWEPYGDLKKLIDLEAVPSQEAECRAWLVQYGREKFQGLNLFGVV